MLTFIAFILGALIGIFFYKKRKNGCNGGLHPVNNHIGINQAQHGNGHGHGNGYEPVYLLPHSLQTTALSSIPPDISKLIGLLSMYNL